MISIVCIEYIVQKRNVLLIEELKTENREGAKKYDFQTVEAVSMTNLLPLPPTSMTKLLLFPLHL